MEFLLTSYIYPLERPVELSPTLRFSLDNPRTEHEINVIRDYLSRSFNLEDTNNLPLDTEDGFSRSRVPCLSLKIDYHVSIPLYAKDLIPLQEKTFLHSWPVSG